MVACPKWERSLGLDYDPDVAVDALSRADKRLGRLIERVGPFTLKPEAGVSPFQALVRAIVYQQLSGKAAGTIYSRVLALFPGGRFPRPEQVLKTPDDAMHRAGMSRAKVAAVKDLALKTLEGVVPPRRKLIPMDDDEIISQLVRVRGVGEWTVQMMLIFQLGRPDVLPVNDLGVRKGFMLTYDMEDMPSPLEVQDYGQRWRPYCSVASWYLWRAVELDG